MKKPTDDKNELVFVPLGGAGEIGMNLYLYGYGQSHNKNWLIVDMGVAFAGPREPGINLIFPDIAFLQTVKEKISGLFITHAHEDHIGAVPHLWSDLKMPVYASSFAGMMLKGKLLERELYGEVPVHRIKAGQKYSCGPFEVEPFNVTHSIPQSMGFIIRVGGKVIVHTGDWRIDESPVLDENMDLERLTQIGEEGCDVLVCDSTNVLSAHTSISEEEVAENLKVLVEEAPARIVVTTFASNVGRVSSLIKAAVRAERHVVLSGRAMERTITLARELGILTDLPNFVPMEEFDNLPRNKVMLVCTGSQGEANAQIARIASGEHNHISLDEGDWVVFSSKTIPGNERDVLAVENKFARLGVRVVTIDEAKIHETGHPRQGELQKIYKALRPACLVPMHGEARHLYAHARFALENGIKDYAVAFNGDMLRFAPGVPEKIDEVTNGRLYEDGLVITEGENGPVKNRRKLGYVGCVVISLIATDRGELVSEPLIVCDGLPERDVAGSMMEDILLDAVHEAFQSMPRKRRNLRDEVSEVIRRAVRRRAGYVWGKKPRTHVLVTVL